VHRSRADRTEPDSQRANDSEASEEADG